MKLIASVVVSALLFTAALSSVNKPQIPIRLTVGQTYVYQYRGRLLAGIPQLQDQYSGFEIQSKIILQPLSDSVVTLQLTNVEVGRHNGPVANSYQEEIVMNHQFDQQYRNQLQKPIRFVYNEGKVVAFEADQSEPEWSLNIKKAILTLFNVNLSPKKIIKAPNAGNVIPKLDSDLTVYPVYEEGIGGICETVYEINNIPDEYNPNPEPAFVLNVTKTRNYDNCLTEPTIVNDNFDVRGCPWVCRKEKSFPAVAGYYPTPDAVTDPYMSGCPCGFEPHESPVDSYGYSSYNISMQQPNAVIESIYSEGKVAYRTYGDELLVIVQQNVSLLAQGSVSVAISTNIPRPIRHTELSFRLPTPQTATGLKAPLDIPYYYLFNGQPNIPELANLVPELLDSLASDIVTGDITSSKDSLQKSVQIVNALAVLPVSALQSLFEEVVQQGQSSRANAKQQVMRKLFLDALPLSGSNGAALFISNLILQNKVTTYEAKELVEAVPQNLFLPDVETIDAYLELFQNPKVQSQRHLYASTGIAFGKMIKEAYVKRQSTPGDIPDGNTVPQSKRNIPAQLVVQPSDPQNPSRVTIQQVLPSATVSQRSTVYSARMKRSAPWESAFPQDLPSHSDVQKYVQIISRLLTEAQTFYQKVTLIETLAHMGVPQVLQVLEPYISGEISPQSCPGYPVENSDQQDEECDFVRQVVIYALSHVIEYYPKQVLPLVLPVYNDPSEPYEVRIAAFTTLVFADADKQVLERIASQLYRESNRQVQSFVYSALQTLGNFSLPCFQSLSRNADVAYDHAPNAEYGMQYSKMFGGDYYDSDRDYGLYLLSEYVSSNISQVPRSGYFSIGQSNGPFQDELLQIGFNAKGVDQLLQRVLEPNGLLSDLFEGMHGKGKDRRVTKRNTDSAQQALQALKEKLNLQFRTDDEPKATIFYKMFDRTSYYPLDKHYILQLIDEAEDSLKDIAASLIQGNDYHYVKLVMPSQLYKVVPSELGIPIVITHRHPTILSINVQNAKLQLETAPRTIYPTGANLTAIIQPSLYYSSYSFAFALNPADKQAYGVNVQKTTQVSLPVELSVGFVRPKGLFTFSVIPRAPQEVIYHKTESRTFIAKSAISGSPDRDWLADGQLINTIPVPFQYEQYYGQDLLGLGFHVQLNTENPWNEQPWFLSQTANDDGFVPAVVEVFRNPGLKPRELHVQLEPDRDEPVYGYDFTVRYKWVAEDSEGADDDDSDESSEERNESDSDESDESSDSDSSESGSDESNQQNNPQNQQQYSRQQRQQKKHSRQSVKVSQTVKQINSRRTRSVTQRVHQSVNQYPDESNESSDEHSNESGSKSSPNSGSKDSSQSSSSSDSSDESTSLEDNVFDYADVMRLIYGQQFKRQTIKRVANELVLKTKSVWQWAWIVDEDESPKVQERTSAQSQQNDRVPAIIAHDIAVTAVTRGPRPSYYAANLLYVHTYDHRTIWFKTDGHIKTPMGVYYEVPTLFCADAVVAYPPLPSSFYYDPTSLQSQKAQISAQLGWGPQCQNKGGVIVKGVMENTEDQVITPNDLAVQQGSSPAAVQNWYYQQCQIDRAEGQPLSYACERAIIEDSYFNQFILDVAWANVSYEFINVTRKLDLALKVALYPNLENNDLFVFNPDNQIRVVAQYSSRVPDVPLVNLRIEKPRENSQYSRVYAPYIRPISSLLPTSEVYYNLLTGYEGTDSCALMEDYVRTFDNVTYQLPDNACQYLVAKDCSPLERFTVYASQLDSEAKTKTITILVSGTEIKLTPPTQSNLLQVIVDGHTYELSYISPITLPGNKNDIRIYLRRTVSEAVNPIAVVEIDNQDLKVLYDGKNAKVLIGNQYQGKTCGLCGDNNDETDDEFLGPDLSVYEDSYDFANSYALSGPHCESAPIPQGFVRRPPVSQHQQQQYGQQYGQQFGQQSGVVRTKDVRVVQTPTGTTTLVRKQVSQQRSDQQQQQQLQYQSNIEEIARKQQQQVERQQARQDGEPLSPVQQQSLVGGTPQQQAILSRMRTQYIYRDDMICFTTKPLLACIGTAVASTTRQVQANFHCLPKNSQFTQDLVTQAQLSVLTQLANKRADIRQVVTVPVACVASSAAVATFA